MSPANDIALILKAVAFAAERHRIQKRKDKTTPYINHPIGLANVLAQEGGVFDPITLCAAILHDTVEDVGVTPAELTEHFGAEICAVVLEVTDDKSLTKVERKRLQVEHAPHKSHRAKLVKLADKICNLRDLVSSPPLDWTIERRSEYFAWAKAVIDGLRGTHPGLEAIFDQVHGDGSRGLGTGPAK